MSPSRAIVARKRSQAWSITPRATNPTREIEVSVEGFYSPAEATRLAFQIIDVARREGVQFADPSEVMA